MGREAKLLLGLLATLMGVFVGVLSMKLLVPRPPAGAGPDIQADVATTDPRDLVEPPQLSTDLAPPAEPIPSAVDSTPRNRFGGGESVQSADPARDPFVSRASFSAVDVDAAPRDAAPPIDAADRDPSSGLAPGPAAASRVPPPAPGSAYVAAAGDSWWSLAEQVYGDGRIYRALFAWNRAIDPRVSLVPGTPIDLPLRDRLEASWPALLPRP